MQYVAIDTETRLNRTTQVFTDKSLIAIRLFYGLKESLVQMVKESVGYVFNIMDITRKIWRRFARPVRAGFAVCGHAAGGQPRLRALLHGTRPPLW